MSKSRKSMLKRLFFLFVASALVTSTLVIYVSNDKVQAASHTSVSDTLSRLKTSQSANHTIKFTLASAWNAAETVVIDFVDGDGWDTTGFANTEAEDYDIKWGAAEKTIVASGSCVADSIEITTVDTTTDTFTFTLCAGSTASGANEVIEIEIGTHASTGGNGDDQIENATASGSKTVTITGPTSGDGASLAIPIMSEDQVTVSATVDPTITSTLSAATCALGTLSSSTIETCNYYNEVTTNAGSGYVATIQDDGNLRSGANDVNDAGGDNDVDQGSEEYGVGTSKSGQTITQNATCPDPETDPAPASAITTSAQQYANATSPINADQTTLCHAASITGTTPAGTYQHIVTHITTGTF